MSKSSPLASSRILLTDTTSDILKKFKRRSYRLDSRNFVRSRQSTWSFELVVNLRRVYERRSRGSCGQIYKQGTRRTEGGRCGSCGEYVEWSQAEFERLREDHTYLAEIAKEGAEKAQERSRKTLQEVRTLSVSAETISIEVAINYILLKYILLIQSVIGKFQEFRP